MKGKQHSAEQFIRELHEAEAMLAASKTIGEICQAPHPSKESPAATPVAANWLKSTRRF